MPYMNRIRVNNVKYNFGTQFYDDFLMRLSGKNTIYDLANGGGKSVLLLLLMQNMIPNCTLDEKQPVEKLFRQGCGNTVIHSLIEWQLNKNMIHNGLKYMTTGFCARKARESAKEDRGANRDTAAVEYFNYVIFYREFGDNDIKNLPLTNGEERITYQGLKNYLRDLGRKNNGLEVRIFERKGDYQRFIAEYGIYESEWEIIRGINKTEGHVRTYFETNYRTTRKVVEDLLIEEIIQKSFYMKSGEDGQEDNLANVLMDIKDKLMELSRKKSEMAKYTRQAEALESFISRIRKMQTMYQGKKELENDVVRAFNTSIRRRKKTEEEKEELLQGREFIKNKTLEISRNIDTALVQIEEAQLEELQNHYEAVREAQQALAESVEKAEKNLNFLESANHYLDYLEVQKQYEENRISMQHMQDSEEELLTSLAELAGTYKKKMDETCRELSETGQMLEEEKQEQEQLLEEKKSACREAEIRLAVNESDAKKEQARQQELEEKLRRCETSLGLLIFTGDTDEYERNQKAYKESKEKTARLQTEQKNVGEEQASIRMRLSRVKYESESVAGKQDALQAFLVEYQRRKEQADKWKEIYPASNGQDPIRVILQMTHRCDRQLADLGEELNRCREQLEAMRQGHYLRISEGISETMQWLERHYPGAAVTGIEYLEGLSEEEAKETLILHPLLPYSILIRKYYEEITSDVYLKEQTFSEYVIPIMDAECVTGQKVLMYPSDMDFAAKKINIFGNEKLKEQEKQRLSESIRMLEEKQEKLRENRRVLEADLEESVVFEREYQALVAGRRQEYEKVRGELKNLDREEEKLLRELGEKKERRSRIREELEEQAEQQERIGRRMELFETALEVHGQLKMMEKERLQREKKKEELAGEIEARSREITAQEKSLADTQKRIYNAAQEVQKFLENWNDNYMRYYREDAPVSGDSTVKIEALDTLFKGRKEAFEKKNSDFHDKKKLEESYRKSMEKELELIRYRGCDEKELEEKHSQHLLERTGKEILASERAELLEKREELLGMNRRVNEENGRWNQKLGSITHGKNQVVEKYGAYDPVAVDTSRLEEYIRENKFALQQLAVKRSEGEEKLKQLETTLYSLDVLREDLERMMNSAGFSRKNMTEELEKGVSLKETYTALRDQYESIRKEEAERREEYERDKNRLAETLTELEAFDLASEVKNQLRTPTDHEEMQEQIDGLNGTIRCIRLEQDSVSQGIEDMNRIKENFESQCLQICLNMKAELDRLPKLSRIRLDDRLISIITLHIPYKKEEEFRISMETYIDETVKNADAFASLDERLRYIRTRLSWKHLFSVIVTDMDAVRLSLYKRERVHEQSRYLKYEEAVGSTGQSQGIYIQFLIAIINYISSINSRDADPKDLKKVIFIDNPFGAAKDIYIWEPIFQLLKNNHVQLVVPARGATPAITGRFEVNYILGQKKIDGRQQTVVVDYRSQTESEELEYTRLSYEQEVLKF